MSLRQNWEAPLLVLAHEALNELVKPTLNSHQTYNDKLLEASYQQCERITAEHSRSFYMASALYPPDKRRAARALYAFCRITDDIVDEADDDLDSSQVYERLEAWRYRALSATPPRDDLVAVAWHDARTRYHVPQRYGEQLFDGVMCDLRKRRYETFDELAEYAYGVASTVGLMSMHITGFVGKEAIPYAVKLGVALQLTNILRDVAEDWRNGRVYLPQSELRQFGLDEDDLARGEVTNRWRAFMQFQIARNRRLYREAWAGIGLLAPDGRFAIAAAAELYMGILSDIERHDYDVFSRRAYMPTAVKITHLPLIWWRSRSFYLRRQPH
ncbi:MAG: squalene/phytoene synthase family protein [Anaerolineales bacterium]|nr:squalene/phytoene synthase family protein [Anaerolineales bacterium]